MFVEPRSGVENSRRVKRAASAASASRASVADALGVQLVEQQAELGVVAHVADDDQRLARPHLLAIAHQDLAHDAAFLMLHGLAIQLDLQLARSDDRTGQRRNDASRA